MTTRREIHNMFVTHPIYRDARKTKDYETMKRILITNAFEHSEKHVYAMLNYKHDIDQFVNIIDNSKVIEFAQSPKFRKGANVGLDLIWYRYVASPTVYSMNRAVFNSVYEKV